MKKCVLILACLALFTGTETEAATRAIYESDFSTNPDWETDQPENFYWNESEEALFMRASITPLSRPSRYFTVDTDLDPTKSFDLRYDFKLIDHFKYSIFTFGLFSDDLLAEQIRRVRPFVTPESTVNFSHSQSDTRFGKSYGFYTNIFTDDSTSNQGSGGSGSTWQPTNDTWYTVVLAYDAETNRLFRTVSNKETGTVLLAPGSGREITGDFSKNMIHLGFSISPQGEFGTTSYDPVRLTGVGSFTVDNVRLTQEAEEEPEPPLSDLLLQYEPILQFHEDEDYFPMNVDAFVEGSGLWDSKFIDEVIVPRGEGNELTLDYLATTTDTSNWYIAFSSDEAGEYDLPEAKSRYDSLVASGRALPTYYAHQSEDSYVDDFGNTHEFIVLQYWYFYAMNDWREKGGFNNHEGDWESVFVFLDKETEEPEYVAFSAHHNDGDPSFNIIQYESVRRTWLDTERSGDQVTSFVAAGSHANYSFAAEHNARSGVDRTSRLGYTYIDQDWANKKMIDAVTSSWESLFEGLFGTNRIFVGSAGTKGPLFTNVSGTQRFHEPVAWAGLDQVADTIVEEPQQKFFLESQGVQFNFDEPLAAGTELASSLHEEFISFGENLSEYNFLPKFWDFTTSLANESFNVDVTISYSDEEVAALNLDENSLRAFYYDATEHIWMVLPSTVDTEENEVEFETDHFSIYAIGEVPKQLLIEGAPIKVNWGSGHKPTDIRTAQVSFQNTTGDILTGPLALVATAEGSATHINTDGTSEYGPYQDILPEEYGHCLFIGTESDLPTDIKEGLKQKLIKNVNLDCVDLRNSYPAISEYLIYGLPDGDYSNKFEVIFESVKENKSAIKFSALILE